MPIKLFLEWFCGRTGLTPNASCDDSLIVSIGQNGVARLFAEVLKKVAGITVAFDRMKCDGRPGWMR